MTKQQRLTKLDELSIAVIRAAADLEKFVRRHGPRKEAKPVHDLQSDIVFWTGRLLGRAL